MVSAKLSNDANRPVWNAGEALPFEMHDDGLVAQELGRGGVSEKPRAQVAVERGVVRVDLLTVVPVAVGPRAVDHRDAGREEELERWAKRITGLAQNLKAAYIYFNNDAEGFAIRNALTITHQLLKT